jgi:hypothetical protein
VNVAGLDVPPPGGELTTVIWAVPAFAIFVKGIPTVIWVGLRTKPGPRSVPFHSTADCPSTNPVPVIVMPKLKDPAVAEFGESELIVGAVLLNW